MKEDIGKRRGRGLGAIGPCGPPLAALWLRNGAGRALCGGAWGRDRARLWQESTDGAGHGSVPDGIGYRHVNYWAGEHGMLEFILAMSPDGCAGCCFSPDGVPLAFHTRT